MITVGIDNMKSNVTMIAIALVAVVAIAGAAVFILNGNGEGGEELLDKTALPIYGNANDDTTIDQKDIDLIQKMIDESIPLEDYPFADADRDGAVTSKDIAIVQKIINGENTPVWFVDQYDLVAGKYHYVKIDYPLRDIVTQNADMLLLTMMIDADDVVAGYVANIANYPNEFYKVTHNGFSKQVGETARYIGSTDWVGIKNLDVELQEEGRQIGAIVVHSKAALGDYEDDIIAAGFPLIFLRCTDPIYSIDAALLLGTLMGPDHAAKATVFANDCKHTISEVSDIVGNIADKDKKRFISLCMICYIAQDESQYTKLGIQAGGKSVVGISGNSSERLQDVEAITKYNNKIDYMINCTTQDCTNVTATSLWEDNGVRYMAKSTHYKDMFWINMSMPVPCRVMYVASMFYPDLVSKADADAYFQSTVDKYMPYLHETVSDGYFDVSKDMFTIITYQDYVNEGGGDPGEKVTSEINAKLVAQHFLDTMDLEGFSGDGFYLKDSSNDQSADVLSNSGNYYVNVKLYNDAKSVFEAKKAEFEQKVGQSSSMGGTYVAMDVVTGFTDGFGYYVNTTEKGQIGSMHYAGYYKECFILIHLAKKPSFSDVDLQEIVTSAWAVDGSFSAVDSANKLDLNLLSKLDYPPYSLIPNSNDMKAEIGCSANDAGKYYYITYDNSSDALVSFLNEKQEYIDKIGTDYMGGTAMAVEKGGFDDGYGFYGQAVRQGGFWMLKFVGYKDGCFVTMYLRGNPEFNDQNTAELVNAVAKTIP